MINIKRLFILQLLFFFFLSANSIAQKTQKINQVDEKGRKTGVWKKYYNNRKIRYQGQFKEGKEVGTFKFYSRASSYHPVIIKNYSSVSDSASVQFFNIDGNLKSNGYMIGKNREGKWEYFFSNGKKLSEEFYANGKLDGVLKNYYNNGKLTEETYYKNGLKNGISKKYTENGILIEETTYVDGKVNGPAKYFDLKGNIKETGSYKDGKKIGKWNFYMDGEIVTKKKRNTHSVKKTKR